MNIKLVLTAAIITLIAGIISCTKTSDSLALRVPTLPVTPFSYTENIAPPTNNPWGNGSGDNTPQANLTTDDGAALGRVLFYDRTLSMNNTVACGSCHKQSQAFADNTNFSTGFQGATTVRNSIGIWNEKMNFSFFFDGRARTLEQQTIMPVKNHVEMGMERIDVLPKKLSTLAYYKPLFKNAFGTEDITKERIADAIAQFIRSMTSLSSKFDEASNNGFSTFTDVEKDGMKFFTTFRCASCHNGNNFNGSGADFANIGLEMNYTDKGLGAINGTSTTDGMFRVPSLRNIALTAPYMHDGRFKNLQEVLAHYSEDIKPHPNLDSRLTEGGWANGGGIFFNANVPVSNGFFSEGDLAQDFFVTSTKPVQMKMTSYQKQALTAFLGTLTDNKYINDPRFSDPFR